ncbi:hypothetical protein K413DRAFT_2196 [Clostridium sp. ASBs410]|nr:hypothetical protein K413DRAFT_2196 [Clostridium sp. ASBs410]
MKRYTIFLVSAVLCASLITGKIVQVYAQQEEVRAEESEQEDNVEKGDTVIQEDNVEQEDNTELADNAEQENSAGNEKNTEASNNPEETMGGDERETMSELEESDGESSKDSAEQEPSGGSDESDASKPEQSDGLEEEEPQTDAGKDRESKFPGESQVQAETMVPGKNEGNPDVAAAMEAAHTALLDQIDYIAGLLDISDDYTLIEGEDNYSEALAVYAIKHNQTRNYPYEVEITGEADFEELQSIYWSLNRISGAKNKEESIIRVARLSGEDVHSMSGSEKKVFKILISNENRDKINALLLD